MSSDYDPTEFIDGDFEARKPTPATAVVVTGPGTAQRAPTREEVDSRVVEAQQRLAELKRAQEQLERERTALEETRRRQSEFQTGRQEMLQHLTRSLGLLEEAEFDARREAEQMAGALVELREALTKIQGVREETWTQENFSVELTRALTALENARMEWNAARLKFPILSGKEAEESGPDATARDSGHTLLEKHGFFELCRLGFALTWPVAAVLALGFGTLLALALRH